jgi:hypothetical protein
MSHFVGQVDNLFPMSAWRTEGGDENGRYLTGSLCWELRTGTRGRRRSGDVEADNLLDLERGEVEGNVRRCRRQSQHGRVHFSSDQAFRARPRLHRRTAWKRN